MGKILKFVTFDASCSGIDPKIELVTKNHSQSTQPVMLKTAVLWPHLVRDVPALSARSGCSGIRTH